MKMGIPFRVHPDGHPIVELDALHREQAQPVSHQPEPNFEALIKRGTQKKHA